MITTVEDLESMCPDERFAGIPSEKSYVRVYEPTRLGGT